MLEAVLLTGGSGSTGMALAEQLLGQGRRVVIASRSGAFVDAGQLADTIATDAGCSLHSADLTSEQQVARLRAELAKTGARVAQIVHLVGGWAGGKGIPGQSEEKYRSLSASFDSLRAVSREFYEDLLAAERPRVVSVSSPIVQAPTASSANYAAVKAATEAWTLALNAGLAAGTEHGAASVVVTDSLQGREASFARLVLEVLDAPRGRVAGQRILHL